MAPKPVSFMVVQRAKRDGQKRTDGVQSTTYKAVEGELKDIRLDRMLVPFMSTLDPVPQNVQIWSPIEDVPPLCDTVFGRVPHGSLLSHQLPSFTTDNKNTIVIKGVPPPSPFIFPVVKSNFYGPLSNECENLFQGLYVTHEQAWEYEGMTRDQSNNTFWP